MRSYSWLGAVLLLVGCSSGPASTAAELTDALAGAGSGSVVEVAGATIEGNFTVPAGVTLRGAGADSTVIRGAAGQVLDVQTAAGSTTRVSGISVESDGAAAMAIGGAGSAELEDVDVRITRGVGIGAEGLATLALTNVTVTGPVTPENATGQPVEPTPETAATHGLVVVDVADATLIEVRVSGIAMIGALFVDSGASWSGGGASQNLGVGMMASGGSMTMDGVQLCSTLQGFRLPPVFAGVFSDGVAVETTGLTVCDNDGFGLVHSSAGGHHGDLVGSGNANAALWVQQTSGLTVDGAATVLSDNEFAGAVVIDSDGVTVADAAIETTRLAVRTVGLTGRVEVGDGLQLVRSTSAIDISGVTLTDNQRAGLLLELGSGSTAGVGLSAVQATGTGTQLGVVAQSGTLEMGWDDGVTRSADLSTNDTAFISAGIPLDIVDVVTPTDFPDTSGLSSSGLMVIGVVTPTD